MILPTGITAQIGSAKTQVNVIIVQTQSITIAQPTVDIQLTQMAQYVSGNASPVQINHISVGSTTNYQVSVRAQAEFLSMNGFTSPTPNRCEIKMTIKNILLTLVNNKT